MKHINIFLVSILFACKLIAQPAITVDIQPMENNQVVYASIAPPVNSQKPKVHLALLLKIKNNESKDINLTRIEIIYSIGSTENIVSDISINKTIPKNDFIYWHQVRDNISKIPFENPEKLKLRLHFNNYRLPHEIIKTLKKHTSPVPGGSYLFPAKTSDLRINEYWQTASTHGESSYGSQLFAYDMAVYGWNKDHWSELLEDEENKAAKDRKNSDYRIYGKPLYAIADGVVLKSENNINENPEPPTYETNLYQTGVIPSSQGGNGNCFIIQYGDEIVTYAHLKKGSLNKALLDPGKKVKAGDFLGLSGNSGNSSNPHLHIEVVQRHTDPLKTLGVSNNPENVSLRPFPFRNTYSIAFDKLLKPDPNASWVKLNGNSIADVSAAIWPSANKPCWYPPGLSELAFHGVSKSAFQASYNKIADCGYYPEWIEAFSVNNNTYFNVIFRPYTPGLSCKALTDLSKEAFNNEITNNAKLAKPLRLVFVDSYLDKGQMKYSMIWLNSKGPANFTYIAKTEQEHQQLFDDNSAKGWVPVNVSVVSVGGLRLYTALYEQKNVGGFQLKSKLSPAEYQSLFEANNNKKFEQVYINAYTHNGETQFSVIWYEHSGYKGMVAVRKANNENYQSNYDANLAAGFTTRCVTGYEINGKASYAASWAK